MTVVLNPYPGLPIAPPTAPPAVPPWEGEPAGAPDFRTLLQGLIYSCAGAPGFLEGTAPEEKAAASSFAPAADIFNQDGFFRPAVAAEGRAQPDPGAAEAPAPAGQTPFIDAVQSVASDLSGDAVQGGAQAAAPMPVSDADAPTLPREIVASAAAVIATGADDVHDASSEMQGPRPRSSGETRPVRYEPLRTLASAATDVTTARELVHSSGGPAAVRTVSFHARLDALLPRLFTQDGAALNTRVSVQAVEHGLQVVAKLGDLAQEERVRLRDRIAATLSRHGLIGREITLNGDNDTASAEGDR